MINTTVEHAERNLAEMCEMAAQGATVIISSPDHEDVAMIAASELSSLMETMHLIRSPANAVRLFTALGRSPA